MKKRGQGGERASESSPFEGAYPNIAAWVSNGGWVEVGYAEYTGSFVRALDEGGMIWEGVSRYESIEDALKALDRGIADWVEEHG
jgi:hypothetical protein